MAILRSAKWPDKPVYATNCGSGSISACNQVGWKIWGVPGSRAKARDASGLVRLFRNQKEGMNDVTGVDELSDDHALLVLAP